MSTVTLKGNTVKVSGELPSVGTTAGEFTLVSKDLSEQTLSQYKGKRVLLNIFPSVDTGTCAMSVRKFNQEAANLDNVVVLCISKDLPFALARFCSAEGIENVETLSAFRSSFGEDYGIILEDGPLKGLLARSIVIIDEEGKILYTELVAEISTEPNYEIALNSLK